MYKMIIVDDESFELELISSWNIWKRYNIEISAVFERPLDALNYLKENHIDIILSDICMPNMSGLDFLQSVKSISPDIIFIFVTAHNNFEYMHTAIVNNVFDYIMKPVHISTIQNLCERILEKLSNNPENLEPNFGMLECNQALIDYFTGIISLFDMQMIFQKNGINFVAANNKTCIIQLKISESQKLLKQWNYSIDQLYSSFINISKNNVFDIIPLEYNQDYISFLGIVHNAKYLDESLDRFVSNCNQIFKCSFTYELLSGLVNFSELSEILSKILIPSNGPKKQKNNIHFSINHALKYIEEHYFEPISLNMLAEHISLSPYHTSRLFKQHTGDSFVNYINQYRINKAKQFLLTSSKTISEISDEIGFSSKNYFIRIFRRYTGITPTEYRNRYSD